MSDELKPVRCGCGGEAIVTKSRLASSWFVYCDKCKMCSGYYISEAEAIMAWNRAMLGNVQECAKDARYTERTAKVIEHDASVTDTDGYKYHRTEYLCDGCKKRVLGGDDYCSHCGCRLIWRDDDE